MKNRFLSLTFLLLTVLLTGLAATESGLLDELLADSSNQTVTLSEGTTYLMYQGTIDMTGGAEDNHYTQAMLIGDANQSTGVIRAIAADSTGTEDINVFVEFSLDRTNWTAVSDAVIDQLSTTQVFDTLSTVNGTPRIEFSNSIWMRLKFDGQSSNPVTTIDWSTFLPKNTGASPTSAGMVRNSN